MTIVAGLMHPAPMHIREWPSTERPRDKLLLRGPGALSDAELLAIFLGSGLPGRDAVQTGRELLEGHGPLRALLDRAPVELARLPGLGPARACQLAAALELGNRHLAAALPAYGAEQSVAVAILERFCSLARPVYLLRVFQYMAGGVGHQVEDIVGVTDGRIDRH